MKRIILGILLLSAVTVYAVQVPFYIDFLGMRFTRVKKTQEYSVYRFANNRLVLYPKDPLEYAATDEEVKEEIEARFIAPSKILKCGIKRYAAEKYEDEFILLDVEGEVHFASDKPLQTLSTLKALCRTDFFEQADKIKPVSKKSAKKPTQKPQTNK